MKTFFLVVWFSVLFFMLGVLSTVSRYQRDFEEITRMCAPYECTTDTECEEEERNRKSEALNRSMRYM